MLRDQDGFTYTQVEDLADEEQEWLGKIQLVIFFFSKVFRKD
jgi:hypothetical protein